MTTSVQWNEDLFAGIAPVSESTSRIVPMGNVTQYSIQLITTVQPNTPVDFDGYDVSVSLNRILADVNNGSLVQLSTDGALPSPLLVSTDYYVLSVADGYIQLAETLEDWEEGTVVVLTTTGTGTQTITAETVGTSTVTLSSSDDGITWVDGTPVNTATDKNLFMTLPGYANFIKVNKALSAGSVATAAWLVAQTETSG